MSDLEAIAEVEEPFTDLDERILIDDVDDFPEVSERVKQIFIKVSYAFTHFTLYSVYICMFLTSDPCCAHVLPTYLFICNAITTYYSFDLCNIRFSTSIIMYCCVINCAILFVFSTRMIL